LDEMNVAEGVAGAQRKLVIVPREPPQALRPLALRVISVRIVSQREARADGKIARMIVQPAVPSFRQEVKSGGGKGGEERVAGEAAGERQALEREQLQVAAVKEAAAGIDEAHGAHAAADGNKPVQPVPAFSRAGEQRFSDRSCLP